MPGFKVPFTAVRRKEITHARATAGNRFKQYLARDSEEFRNLGNGKTTRLNVRVQPCSEQNLVRINVPDSRDGLLMHHERLQAP
jgi:hypothetical protein